MMPMYGHCLVVIWTVAVQLGDPGPDTVLPDPASDSSCSGAESSAQLLMMGPS